MVEQKRFWEWFQLVVIGGMFALAAARWGSIPDQVPIHWNAAGEVDGYGGKFVALLLMPILTLGIYLLLRFVPRIDPARQNYQSFAGTYLLVRVLVTVYMAFAFVVVTLAIGNEETVPVTGLLTGSIGVLFIILGGAMGKFRPNWFAGIRTPWTLTSKRSWIKTHRLGGKVFIAAGVATLVGALFGSEWAIYAMMAVTIPGVVYLVVYSYFVWRDDPDKIAAQDVQPDA